MDALLSRRAYHTGLVGTLVALGWFAAYGLYGKLQLPGGGPVVPNFARVLPLHSEHRMVARDFFDVITILIIAYVVMTCVERLRFKHYWVSSLGVALCGLLVAWGTALGVVPWDPAQLLEVGRVQISPMEVVMGGSIVSQLTVPVVYLYRHKRSWFNGANLKRGMWRGFVRWLTGYATLWLLALVFLTHPYFKGELFSNARLAFNWLLVIHLVLGLPYALLTNWLRYDLGEDRKDPGFGLMVFYSRASEALIVRRWAPLLQVLRKPWVRSNLLDLLCVKFFFLPIMLAFVFSESGGYFNAIRGVYDALSSGGEGFSRVGHQVLMRGVMLTDVVIGVLGYAGTSRWLHNKSRSVDPTMSGWVWALMCYPPFNHASGELFPFHAKLGSPLFHAQWVNNLCSTGMLICFAVYAWATVAFGLRFSNMTHRGVIRHGPYAIVRHPAYIAKGVAWLFELLPILANYWQVIGLFAFVGVYLMRGITEERHLSSDPEYRDYCRQVKWRFIPGVL